MRTKFCSGIIALALLAGSYQGTAKGTTVFPVETNPAVVAFGAGLAFDGTNYLVEMCAGTNGSKSTNVIVQLVSAGGAPLGAPTVVGGGEFVTSAAGLAFGQTNYLVAWTDGTISSGVDMFGQFISRSGAKVGSAFNLLSAQGPYGFQNVKALASDGTNFLTIWEDGDDNYIYGQLVTPSGTLSGPEFIISSQPGIGGSAAVAFGKTNYLVVWQNNNQAFGEYISANGSAGSPFQIGRTASTDESSVAGVADGFDGTNFLAVWEWDPGPETGLNVTNWQIYGRLVSQTGTFPGSEVILTTNNNQVFPELAFDGANYLLVYGDDSNTTNSDRNLCCQFLDRSANPVGPIFTPFAARGTNAPLFVFNGILFNGAQFAIAATLGTVTTANGNEEVTGFPSGEVFGAFIPASTTPPTLSASNPVEAQFPLQLNGTPGINYTIQFSTNLALPGWTGLTTNSPANGTFDFTDTSATNTSRFYRALKQ